tara:strand:+ start:4568 stop:4987 length:420 start_codon:yes stop_codon:yes gene_type:complete
MIKNLFKRKSSIANINIHEADIALRLMFEIAISDGKLEASELQLIKKRAAMSVEEDETISSIIKKIIDESENSVSLYPTVKIINETFKKEDKLELLEILWELVTIDEMVDPYEENLYFKIADLIKIPRSKANQIKQNAT